MLTPVDESQTVNEHTVGLIVERVAQELREELEMIAAELSVPRAQSEQLTVEQVAQRFAVARSTVYAHWREWGGYKLGAGSKARIRFDSATFPVMPPDTRTPPEALVVESVRKSTGRRGRDRRGLLRDAPRFTPASDRQA
jgi:hypothetical protein